MLEDVEDKPLGRLLAGTHREAFDKAPRTIGLRDLHRDMSGTLQRCRREREYLVLTNRGAPSFLIIPIDPRSWTLLLAAAPPQTDVEIREAKKLELERPLPDTATVLAGRATRRPTVTCTGVGAFP